MSPTEYEKAVLEFFRIYFPSPKFDVRHNVQMLGAKSRIPRQVDIAIYSQESDSPPLIVEAKRYTRPIDAEKAGGTIALIRDVDTKEAFLVSANGFTKAAENYLQFEGISGLVITLPEARSLNWIPHLNRLFPLAPEFKLETGRLVEALRVGCNERIFEEAVGFEEWLAAIELGRRLFPVEAETMLWNVAREHCDPGYRFNAVSLLESWGALAVTDAESLMKNETDPDTIDLLSQIM